MRLKLWRKPIRKRWKITGHYTVNTRDARITSRTWKRGRLSHNTRTGWRLRLPFGINLGTK